VAQKFSNSVSKFKAYWAHRLLGLLSYSKWEPDTQIESTNSL